ncbi:hypothetical protein K6L05_12065, partial [Salinicoccus roseus]|nr:hypothetical protein [Salinicoccus roseus]
SIAFLGIFKAYTKNLGVAALLALLNFVTAGIAAIIILFLYNRKLEEDAFGIVDETGEADKSI